MENKVLEVQKAKEFQPTEIVIGLRFDSEVEKEYRTALLEIINCF